MSDRGRDWPFDDPWNADRRAEAFVAFERYAGAGPYEFVLARKPLTGDNGDDGIGIIEPDAILRLNAELAMWVASRIIRYQDSHGGQLPERTICVLEVRCLPETPPD